MPDTGGLENEWQGHNCCAAESNGRLIKEGNMKIDLSDDDLRLIQGLLSQEIDETNIGVHHCRNVAYKEYLKDRLRRMEELRARLENPVVLMS